MKYHRTLNECKMVVFVVQTSRYFGPCRILPYPAVSCRILPYLPYPAVSCRILPYPAYPAVSCRILPYPAISCRILPYPAVSCRILPYPAVSCRILPYPALSNTRNRETLMVLQGNAISQFVRTTYGSFSSEDMIDDVVGLFTATAPGIALSDRLNARMNKQKRYKKRAKDAIQQGYTPTGAVWLVMELEMPKKKVVFIAMSLFCVIDALCNRSWWCASDQLHTFEAASFSYLV